MKKLIIILIISAIAVMNVFSQALKSTKDELFNPKNRIGFSGSMISGWGLTYQHNFDPLAVKAVVFYYYYKNGDGTSSYDQVDLIGGPFNYNDKQALGSFGLELKYYVFKSRYVNLYPFIGGSYWFDNNESLYTEYRYENNVPKTYVYTRQDNTGSFMGGAGFGFELIAGKYVAFNFDIGLSYRNSQIARDNYAYPPVRQDLEDIYFGVAVGGGVSFAF